MKNNRKFKMNILDWIEDKLVTYELYFNTLYDAKQHCANLECGKIKIYDHEGHLIHSEDKKHHHKHETYC